MQKYLFIGIGGFWGCIARFYLSQLFYGPLRGAEFPWGTFVINLMGSLIIGLLAAFFRADELHPGYRLFFIVGLLGGFTTFSTFSYETLDLLINRKIVMAAIYSLGSLLGGLILTGLGLMLGKFMTEKLVG